MNKVSFAFTIVLISFSVSTSGCPPLISSAREYSTIETLLITSNSIVVAGSIVNSGARVLIPNDISGVKNELASKGVILAEIEVDKIIYCSETIQNDGRMLNAFINKVSVQVPAIIPFWENPAGDGFLEHDPDRRNGIFIISYDSTFSRYRLNSSHSIDELNTIADAIAVKITMAKNWIKLMESK